MQMQLPSHRTLPAVVAVTVLAVVGSASSWTPVRAAEPAARYDAVAVNTSNVGRRGASTLQITIERWSNDADRAALRDALVEKGEDALLNALKKIKPRAGSISTPGHLGWAVQYAQRIDLPGGGHRIVFATDRPMTFLEEWNRPRSADYKFMLCELRIGPDGKGEGKLVPRARISWDDDARTVVIDNYASEPVRLTEVREAAAKP